MDLGGEFVYIGLGRGLVRKKCVVIDDVWSECF